MLLKSLIIPLTWFVPSLTFNHRPLRVCALTKSFASLSLEKKQQSVITKVCHVDLIDLLFQTYGILKLVYLPLYIKSKTLLKIKSEAN